MPLKTRDDLSMAYTPGVARVCRAIAERPEDVRRLTIKRNTIAVLTDGSAVLGLGNIGPAAALPVMEGKAALFKRFAGIDAFPICLDTQDTEEIIRTAQVISPVFGGINLEDIAAPRCFEIERRLRDLLDIPVFHDDQHGTAIVVLAALINALRVVDKPLPEVRIVMSGAGAAGTPSSTCCCWPAPPTSSSATCTGSSTPIGRDLDDSLRWIASKTNHRGLTGPIARRLRRGGRVHRRLGRRRLTEADVASMADDSIVFALANPDPEIDPVLARRHARVVATGRSDFPNQINNVLAFPGVFRGLLDAQSSADPGHGAAGRRPRLGRRRRRRRATGQLHHPERVPPRSGVDRRRSREQGRGRVRRRWLTTARGVPRRDAVPDEGAGAAAAGARPGRGRGLVPRRRRACRSPGRRRSWPCSAGGRRRPVGAAVGVLVGVLVTGAFHEDGLADLADAVAGGTTPERRLEILRDPHHGTYGVAALCGSIVLRIIIVGSLPASSPSPA